MTTMAYTYEDGLGYIYIRPDLKITHTVDVSDDVILDFHKDTLVGIELLSTTEEDIIDRLPSLSLCVPVTH